MFRKSFKRKQTMTPNPIPGRKWSVLTGRVIEAVKKRMKRNPWRSIQKMAKEQDIFDRLLRRIVKKDLGIKPCKIQLLSSASKQKRVKQIEENVGGNAVYCSLCLVRREVFRCGGCGQLSKHNRVYITSLGNIPEGVRIFFKWQKPTGLLLLPVVIERRVKVNIRIYQQMLRRDALSRLSATFGSHCVFTQDGALALFITNRWTLLCQCILSTANSHCWIIKVLEL